MKMLVYKTLSILLLSFSLCLGFVYQKPLLKGVTEEYVEFDVSSILVLLSVEYFNNEHTLLISSDKELDSANKYLQKLSFTLNIPLISVTLTYLKRWENVYKHKIGAAVVFTHRIQTLIAIMEVLRTLVIRGKYIVVLNFNDTEIIQNILNENLQLGNQNVMLIVPLERQWMVFYNSDNKLTEMNQWNKDHIMKPVNAFIDYTSNLQGINLTASTFHQPPLVLRESADDFRGVEANILSVLARKMNFQIVPQNPADDMLWGYELANGTWVGLMGDLVNRRVDLAVADLFYTAERIEVADFSEQYFADRVCWAVPKAPKMPPWMYLHLPFPIFGWCFILVFLVFSSVILWLMNLKTNLSFNDLVHCFLNSLSFALGYSVSRLRLTKFFLIIVGIWLFCYQIISNAYKAEIFSYLAVPPYLQDIDTLQQLLEANIKLHGHEALRSLYYDPTDEIVMKVYHKYEYEIDPHESLNRVIETKDLATLQSLRLLEYYQRVKYTDGSSFHIAKDCAATYIVGCMLPRGSPYTPKMNTYIRQLVQAGLPQYWYDEILFNVNLVAAFKENNIPEDIVITLKMLEGNFYVIFIGWSLSLLSYIGELCFRKVGTNSV